jgi:hypothetical protein
MRVLDQLIDSEGFRHIEVQFEPGDTKSSLDCLNLDHIEDVDRREETGFEFWHIKGV